MVKISRSQINTTSPVITSKTKSQPSRMIGWVFNFLELVLCITSELFKDVIQGIKVMIKIRINKNKDLKEYVEEEEPEHLTKAQDRLYEIHREIQELEQQKLDLQYKIKRYIQAIKKMQGRLKSPTQDQLFKYCNNLNDVSKGKYGED